MNSRYFGFKTAFMTIGILQVVLSSHIFIQGIVPAMSQFGVPEVVLHCIITMYCFTSSIISSLMDVFY